MAVGLSRYLKYYKQREGLKTAFYFSSGLLLVWILFLFEVTNSFMLAPHLMFTIDSFSVILYAKCMMRSAAIALLRFMVYAIFGIILGVNSYKLL